MFLRMLIVTILSICQIYSVSFGQSIITGFSCQYEIIGDDPDNSEEVIIRVRANNTRRCESGISAVNNFYMAVADTFYSEYPGYNIRAMFDSITPVENPDYSCLIIPDPPCYNLFHLSTRSNVEFTIPKFADDQLILIADDRCCRDADFTNVDVISSNHFRRLLVNFTVTGKAIASHNKSPVVVDEIPTIFCKGVSTVIQQPMTDEEGDQVVFKFCAPLLGNNHEDEFCTGAVPICPPFEEISYNFPEYTPTRPLGLNSTLEMDPLTGEITVIPEQEGRFLVGICLEEYRDGALLSIMRREAQFYVVDCIPKVEARIPAPEMKGDTAVFPLCNETTLTIPNESTDTNFITNYFWIFETAEGLDTFYQWKPTIDFGVSGDYHGQLFLESEDGCDEIAPVLVRVNTALTAEFTYSYDTCVAGAVSFLDASSSEEVPIISWSWDFGNQDFSSFSNPVYRYTAPGSYPVILEIEDEYGCRDSLIEMINWQPAPALLIVDPSSFAGCTPLEVSLTNLSTPVDTTYQTRWDFGDGTESTEISPQHTYTVPGTYTISLSVTSPLGCRIDTIYQNWIQVDTSVVANFEYLPEILDFTTDEIELFNKSERAVGQSWLFNDVLYTSSENLTYRIIDTGKLVITLFAWDQYDCVDSISQILSFTNPSTYFLPNAFTPNGDGNNEIFVGVGVFDNIQSFQIRIFDRWGQEVFSSTDPNIGWNGRYQNVGKQMPPGVYTYQGIVSFLNEDPAYLKGNVVLVL